MGQLQKTTLCLAIISMKIKNIRPSIHPSILSRDQSTTTALKIRINPTTNLSMAIVRKGLSTTMGLDVEGEQRRASAKKKGRGDLLKLNVMISSCVDLIFVIRRGVKRNRRPAQTKYHNFFLGLINCFEDVIWDAILLFESSNPKRKAHSHSDQDLNQCVIQLSKSCKFKFTSKWVMYT